MLKRNNKIYFNTSINYYYIVFLYNLIFSGEFVEDAFLKTAQKIYECIQDGRYVLFDLLLIQHYIELD